MPYKDVREFLEALEEAGELVRVKSPVDLDVELGAICRKASDDRAPAIWFERPGDGEIPIVVNTFANRERFAIALETTPEQFHHERAIRAAQPVSPSTIMVDEAPCKENIMTGDDVDLRTVIPVPKWNELDGGPIITLPACFSHDAETGQRNVGIYRLQIHDRDTMGIRFGPGAQLMQHARPVLEKGMPFPVAFAIGVDPLVALAAATALPVGMDELVLTAALRGEPIAMVECETVPVQVPASAEFVIEGELLPGVVQEEGPFGDVTGYYDNALPCPVIKVTAVTHRNNPIHVAAYTGRPPSENAMINAILMEGELWRTLPGSGIQQINVTQAGSGGLHIIASIRKTFEGQGKMVGMAILGSTSGGRLGKFVTIVDHDVDPFDMDQVEWAVTTRVQPHRDIEIINALHGHGLDPSIDRPGSSLNMEKLGTSGGTGLTSKMIIDATRWHAKDFHPDCQPSAEVMKRIEEKWETYGISQLIPSRGAR